MEKFKNWILSHPDRSFILTFYGGWRLQSTSVLTYHEMAKSEMKLNLQPPLRVPTWLGKIWTKFRENEIIEFHEKFSFEHN